MDGSTDECFVFSLGCCIAGCERNIRQGSRRCLFVYFEKKFESERVSTCLRCLFIYRMAHLKRYSDANPRCATLFLEKFAFRDQVQCGKSDERASSVLIWSLLISTDSSKMLDTRRSTISRRSTPSPRRTTNNVEKNFLLISQLVLLADVELDKLNTDLAEMLRGLELRKRAYYVNMPNMVYTIGRLTPLSPRGVIIDW